MKKLLIALLLISPATALAGPAAPSPLPPADGGPSVHQMIEMAQDAIAWWLSIC